MLNDIMLKHDYYGNEMSWIDMRLSGFMFIWWLMVIVLICGNNDWVIVGVSV